MLHECEYSCNISRLCLSGGFVSRSGTLKHTHSHAHTLKHKHAAGQHRCWIKEIPCKIDENRAAHQANPVRRILSFQNSLPQTCVLHCFTSLCVTWKPRRKLGFLHRTECLFVLSFIQDSCMAFQRGNSSINHHENTTSPVIEFWE